MELQNFLHKMLRVISDFPSNGQCIHASALILQINKLASMDLSVVYYIKETLRIHLVAPVLFHHCTDDTEFQNFVVPTGTDVVISSWFSTMSVNWRKDVWNVTTISIQIISAQKPYWNEIHTHFSLLAMMITTVWRQRSVIILIKVILAKLFRKYQFSTYSEINNIKFLLEVTWEPTNDIMVKVVERTQIEVLLLGFDIDEYLMICYHSNEFKWVQFLSFQTSRTDFVRIHSWPTVMALDVAWHNDLLSFRSK